MQLRHALGIIQRRLWVVGLTLLVIVGGTYLVSIGLTPTYEASATLLVGQGLPTPGEEYASSVTAERSTKTYAAVMKSAVVLDAVADSLGPGLSRSQLDDMISVIPITNTQLLKVTVADANPTRAAAIANRVAEVFIQQNEALRRGRFDSAQQEVEQRLASVDADITKTQVQIAYLTDPKDPEGKNLPEFVRAELSKLESSLARLQLEYAQLLKERGDLYLASTKYATDVVLSSRAEVPLSPTKPNIPLNTLVAVVIGLGCSLGFAFFLETMDDTIKSADDITRLLGLTPLATILRLPGPRDQDKLVTAHRLNSYFSEAYRMLRTNLQFSQVDRPVKTLVVTSPAPLEGKSLTVANLGIVMAQAGSSVILVDSDLRKPSLHEIFDLPNEVGLTSALMADGSSVDGSLQNTEVANLRVLPSGPTPPNPSELLGSKRMRSLIPALADKADIVIFDSPPILAVADGAVLAGQVDGVLMVLEAGATPVGIALRGKEELSTAGARVIGVVLNKLKASRSRGYYYHYYSDGKRKRGRPHRS